MSVKEQIDRIEAAKSSLKTAIEGKGVTVPSTTKIDGYGALVESIPTVPPVTSVNGKTGAVELGKGDVGLGNVPNVSTNNQTPTYTAATTLVKLTSGEKLSAAMGKIAKAITDLISHIGNKNNPHGVTAAQAGAATADHDHSGQSISPAAIELFPGASAGNGGYIDFHYNNSPADYTSRLIEVPPGVVKYNNYGLISTANITAIYNVHVSFASGVFEYSNSAIKATSVCFAQFRGSAVTSGFQDTVLGVTSYAGKLRIIAKNGGTFETDVNILIINL